MISRANAPPGKDVWRVQGSEVDSCDGKIIDVGRAAPSGNTSTDMTQHAICEAEQAKVEFILAV